MNPNLFVYGSLLSGAGHAMGARLRAQARLLGPASIQGRLYRVSWYPGAVASTDPGHRVHGEVYVLADPAPTMAWLDAYEGIDRADAEAAEYRRVEVAARLAAGEVLAAWAYLYARDVSGLQEVAGGRWVPLTAAGG